jgi:hypothetical protein
MYAYHGSTDGLCGGGLECLANITLDTYSSLVGFLSRQEYVLSIHVFVGSTQHSIRLGTTGRNMI